MKHENNGKCSHCCDLFDTFPNFHPSLRAWFNALQKKDPSAHISAAGRGRVEQEIAVAEGFSRAQYGQSAHNYNMAIDIFQLLNGEASYEEDWYEALIAPALVPMLLWYGNHGSYREYPHVEIRNWTYLKDFYPLVEP